MDREVEIAFAAFIHTESFSIPNAPNFGQSTNIVDSSAQMI
jgi:hypothetical protein